MIRLNIEHITRYDYKDAVSKSYNESRMNPTNDGGQHVLEYELKVGPGASGFQNYKDYWGTRVTSFDLQGKHNYLELRSHSRVEVHRNYVEEYEGLTWDELEKVETVDAVSDYIHNTELTAPGEELCAIATKIRAESATPKDAVQAVLAAVKEHMTYQSGVTGVHTDAAAAWTEGKGVCQDLAHVVIALLRGMGIPARYVSGYLHPKPKADIGETVVGESHAWVDWWDGQWRAWDPTNHTVPTDFHVTVTRARDYKDVAPLRGMLSGGTGTDKLTVEVKMTREA